VKWNERQVRHKNVTFENLKRRDPQKRPCPRWNIKWLVVVGNSTNGIWARGGGYEF